MATAAKSEGVVKKWAQTSYQPLPRSIGVPGTPTAKKFFKSRQQPQQFLAPPPSSSKKATPSSSSLKSRQRSTHVQVSLRVRPILASDEQDEDEQDSKVESVLEVNEGGQEVV